MSGLNHYLFVRWTEVVYLIDAFAQVESHARHLRPVWEQLPSEVRDHWYTGAPGDEPIFGDNPTLIAAGSALDLTSTDRPVCLIEHGAGQSYDSVDTSGYAGGRGRERVSLFLCPNERVAEENQARYPDAQVAVIGCPALDQHYGTGGNRGVVAQIDALPEHVRRWGGFGPSPHGPEVEVEVDGGPTVVAFAWHWDCNLCPETQPAFAYYRDRIPQIADTYKVLGSGHPRNRDLYQAEYDSMGIETCWDPDELIRCADLLVVDNSSLLYEAAACGVPILAVDAPGYRSEVDHGLRFWDRIPGLRLRAHRHQRPEMGFVHERFGRENLLGAIEEALADQTEMPGGASLKLQRSMVSDEVYGPLDGKASERAVSAILEWIRA